MIVLTLRTDKPEAEIGLYEDGAELTYETWQAHRQLAETIHKKIENLLHSKQLTLVNLNGIVVFQGPGSFTGLRIGLTVANALAMGLNIPVVATRGDDWRTDGMQTFASGENQLPVTPYYGADPHITAQKK
ncbi:tRNA (adenosine(37)-N6)-threonylcarbamoyltransferase complex dimerization subunit type 1 TsaB [Candidatus Saccharibacteria bacterium]|nr:tRNA (adenosine(37)-N6)-threonylcarbamoyltransferase complex dimerization subunit type 1 TsaB [Candidatus Saccharibacteria bacterium]